MSSYVLCTDSTCDMPAEFYTQRDITCIPYTFILNNKEYQDDYGTTVPLPDFYAAIREGSMPTTSNINQVTFAECFIPLLEQGKDIIYLGFSSGLSSTFSNAALVAKELKEHYPQRNIYIVDTLCATCGQAKLVDNAYQKMQEGLSAEQLVRWVEQFRYRVVQMGAISNLEHLFRGGRMSRSEAVVGKMLRVKPIIRVMLDGTLTSTSKVAGNKKALKTIVKEYLQRAEDPFHQKDIYIIHSDAEADALLLQEYLVEEGVQRENISLHFVGPVIGSHTGDGLCALIYIAKENMTNHELF